MLRRLTQTGDTIVEVLIALAILGSAFGISYATANQGLSSARNSEEHSQALQYINKQLELLRSAAQNADANTPTGIFKQTVAFCLTESAPVAVVPFTSGYTPGNDATANVQATGSGKYPAACSVNGLYNYAITYTKGANQDVYKVYVSWQGIGTFGAQQETLSYKLHP